MMKNLLFTLALVAGATTCNAQALSLAKTDNMSKIMQNAKAYNKPMMQFSKAEASAIAKAPRKTVATGVYYQRPEGTLYSGYVFGSNGEYAALTVPPLTLLTYKNCCTNAAAATWSFADSDVSSYADENNNLIFDFNPNSQESGYTTWYAPVIACGGEEFSLTEITMTVSDFSPLSSENLAVVNQYTGFSDGPAWGTNSALESSLESQIAGASVLGYLKCFEKPASPMYVSSIDILAWSEQQTPIPAGKEVTAIIYEMNDSGRIVGAKDTLICNSMDELKAFTSGDGYYGYANFSKTVENEFGDKESAPITIDYPFGVYITGYKQTGVDTRFFLVDNGDDDNEFDNCYPTFLVTQTDQGTSNYYWKNTTASGINYCYTLPMLINTFYDKIDVLEDTELTDGTQIKNVNILRVSADGKTITTEGYTEDTGLGAAIVYTALPILITDDEGTVTGTNYDFNGIDDASWLSWQIDNSYWDNYAINYMLPVCEALPDGVTGRSAVIELAGKGVTANAKIYVLQGDATIPDGIESVTVAKNNKATNGIYNLAGQRVSKATKGLVIANGKKLINK